MAQPTNYVPDILLTKKINAGATYTSASILAEAPTAKLIILLSHSARIGVGGGDLVEWTRGDTAYLTAGRNWTFAEDAEVALATIINVVP